MGLVLPASVERAFDVYWVELSVTFQDVQPTALDEMAFNVELPTNSIALELVPLRYGVRVNRDETTQTPEIEVGVGGNTVKVGEIFKTIVSYNYIKPTVQAFGLGRNVFSWTLTDEAVQMGSHKFYAVLGVPKGSDGVDMAMSGHFRLRKSLIGSMLGDEIIAGTDRWILPVAF